MRITALCLVLVAGLHAVGRAEAPCAAEMKEGFKAFIMLAEKRPGVSLEAVEAAAAELAVAYQEAPRSETFSALLTGICELHESRSSLSIIVRAMLPYFRDHFAFTQNEIWTAAQGFLDYHAPLAVEWLYRFFITKPEFTNTSDPDWEGKKFLDYIYSPERSPTEKLSMWYCFLRWNKEFALANAYDVFDVSPARKVELEALFAAARPALFTLESVNDPVEEAVLELIQAPEGWVRLLVSVIADRIVFERHYNGLSVLKEDPVAIIRVQAMERFRYIRDPAKQG